MKTIVLTFGILTSSFAMAGALEPVQQTIPVQQSTQEQAALPSAHDGMMQAMTNMCSNMDSMAMTGDVNADFAMMMIPHHQSAVEMASAYLTEGADPMLVKMANKIIKDQQKEIADLQQWLEEHKKNQSTQLVN